MKAIAAISAVVVLLALAANYLTDCLSGAVTKDYFDSKIEVIESKIDTLTARVSRIERKIDTLTVKVDAIGTDTDSIKAKVNENGDKLDVIKGDLEQIKGNEGIGFRLF